MRLNPAIFPVAFAGALLAACEMTPYQELASFQAQAAHPEADAALERVAQRHGLTLNRDPEPRESAIPRNYLATVLRGRCMLFVEGSGDKSSGVIQVTLEVVEGSRCDRKMRTAFTELRNSLLRRPA